MGDEILFRLRSLFRRRALERELDDELRDHIERQTELHISQGMNREEAARQAAREFGGLAIAREDSRAARGVPYLDTLFRDLRYALRILGRSPVFTVVAVASLALGIGANTAIFTLLDAVRLRFLPLKNPEQLVHVRIADMTGVRGSVNRPDTITYPIWEQLRDRQEGVSGLFAWADGQLNFAPEGEVRMERNLWVSGAFFSTLGLTPAAGRLLGPQDDYRGCGAPVAVASYTYWKSDLGGDASAIGRRVTVNGHSVEIIGVAPRGFFGLDVGRSFAVALPLCSAPDLRGFSILDAGTMWWLTVMGRLQPGWTPERASAQLRAASPAVFQASLPGNYPSVSVKNYLAMQLVADSAASGISRLRAGYTEPLGILLVIGGLVLLIACGNLANLMLARAGVRAREFAVRAAIGASRGRLTAQLMAENLLLASAGAALGPLLARVLSRQLVALLSTDPKDIYLELHTDWRVIAFTAVLAIGTCLLFGIAPTLRATRGGPASVMRQSGRGLSGSREGFGARRLLAAAQVALSLVLLVGALLFTGTLRNLMRVDTGFETRGVFIVDMAFARATPLKASAAQYQQGLLERIAEVPGVAAVADTSVVPLSGQSWGNSVWRDGAEASRAVGAPWSRVSPGYFSLLGVRLLAGRDFDRADALKAPPVAIVSAEFARRIMQTDSPVGQRFRKEATPSEPEVVYRIVGVVADTRYRDLRESRQPVFYLPMSQDPAPNLTDQLLIRSAPPPSAVMAGVRRAIGEFDPGARFAFGEMKEMIDGSLVRERLLATLSTAFGLLAGLLAAIGLYGVMAYTVARRTNEIGIRLALGATPGGIVRMVLGESGRVVAVGIAAGAALSLWLSGFVRKLLFGLEPTDSTTFVAAAAVLSCVALAAAWLPARRAARLDPTSALREE